MSSAAVAIALSVAGGLCELAGLALVVCGIHRDRRQAQKLLAPPEEQPPPRPFPGRESPPMRSVSYGPSHASDLARQVAHLETAVANVVAGLQHASEAALDAAVAQARRDLRAADAGLRAGLLHVLAGSVRDRAVGAALLLVGIGLATAGSVLGASG